MLLADQGAEVLEIERPDREGRLEDAQLGRGKELAFVDLKDPDAQERVLSLARGADIVIDNLGPGRAAQFGLDYPRIRERNPAAVYVSIPGFAEGGPLANTAAWRARSTHPSAYTPTFMRSVRFSGGLRSSPRSRWRRPMAACMPRSRR
jgi:crotonobetainyl-CoA:carnitine CoA-transferase CaiB-like acyl-CoA transferase